MQVNFIITTAMKELNDVIEQIEAVEALLSRELGEAVEGLDLLESVAMLVSQRENARNAHAAMQEAASQSRYQLQWNFGESACGFDSILDVQEFIRETLPMVYSDPEEVK